MLPSSKIFIKKTNNTKPDVAIILGSGSVKFFEKKPRLRKEKCLKTLVKVTLSYDKG